MAEARMIDSASHVGRRDFAPAAALMSPLHLPHCNGVALAASSATMVAKPAKSKPRAAKSEPEPRPLTHPEIKAIVLGIMLAMFLGALDQTIVATALPTIGRHFGNLDDLSWVVTAYLLTGTASTPLYGKLSDIYGRRVVMLTAIVYFVAGSLVCALLWGLFAWRLVATLEPFLPLTVLGNPVVRGAALAGACNMGTLVGMTIFVPLYFEVVLHMSASQSGLALIPLMGATVISSTVTGRLMMHVTHYKLSLIHISEPTRRTPISYAVFCLKKKKLKRKQKNTGTKRQI